MSRLKAALVTGASTPLGRRLCSALVDAGVRVLAVGLEAVDGVDLPEPVQYERVDLSRPRELHDLFFGKAKQLAVDTVFHLATHRRLDAKGERVHALNVEALRQMLQASEKHPSITRFVYRSFAEVYRVEQGFSSLVDEEQPLDLSTGAPQWQRDRVEADLLACSRMGMTKLEIIVLRCADVYAADSGSQMHDYLRSYVCLRPLGFDPMINLLAIDDAVAALLRAGQVAQVQGVFNVPGRDVLPLAACVRVAHRLDVPLPGPIVSALYTLRRRTIGAQFSYRLSGQRLHFPSLLDGRRAAGTLGYKPQRSALRPERWLVTGV